jgi:UDP-glucose 4-epimerase
MYTSVQRLKHNMKALITGGAGFIGSHIAEHLFKTDNKVFILDDLSGGYIENIPVGCTFIKGSVTDYELLKQLFEKEKFEFVYHLAAYAAESLSHFIRRYNYENNLIASINLINLSVIHKIKCFVFTSSVAVYGHAKPPLKENGNFQPSDPYGIAKFAVELDLKAAYQNFGLNSIIFRPHNVFGERQNLNDKYRNVIGIFINQLLSDMPMTIYGDGKQSRAFTYINDIVPIIAESVFTPKAFNNTFNIGGEEVISVNELSEIISEFMHLPCKRVYLQERNESKHNYTEHSLIKTFFDIESSTSIRDGLIRMVEWVKSDTLKVTKTKNKDVEIAIGLPVGWES